jgi:uncharacterized protein YecT (DUF1311 family)
MKCAENMVVEPNECRYIEVGSKLKKCNMRHILTIIISFTCLAGFSQTQADMNRDANESYKKTDKELNEIYKTILSEYKSDTVFIKNLKASQRIWVAFRDAELKVKYPETDTRYYGSVYPMCVSSYLEKLTHERIKTLREWTEGVEEGDVCNGSVRINEK